MSAKENEHWLSITDFENFSNDGILFDLMEYFFPVKMNIQKNGTGIEKIPNSNAILSNWKYIDYTITLSNIFTGETEQFDYKTGIGISILESSRVFETLFFDLNMSFLRSSSQLANELGIEHEQAKETFKQLSLNKKKQKTVYGIKDFSTLAGSSHENALHYICLNRLNAKIKQNQDPQLEAEHHDFSKNYITSPQSVASKFDDENIFKQRAKVLVLYCFCDLNIPEVITQLEKQLTLYKKMLSEEQFTKDIQFFKQINDKTYDEEYAKIKANQLDSLELRQNLDKQIPSIKRNKITKSL